MEKDKANIVCIVIAVFIGIISIILYNYIYGNEISKRMIIAGLKGVSTGFFIPIIMGIFIYQIYKLSYLIVNIIKGRQIQHDKDERTGKTITRGLR